MQNADNLPRSPRFPSVLLRWGWVALLVVPIAISAQEAPTVTVEGQVVDSVTRAPVEGAVVRLNARTAAVTNQMGQFSLTLPFAAVYALQVDQFGYATSHLLARPPQPGDRLMVYLRSNPIELEGFRVTVQSQFERRRFLSARHVTVIDAATMAEKGGVGVELLRRILPLTRGCYDEQGRLCFGSPFRKTVVSICIDDQPAYGGTSDMDRFEPWELHSIELFDSGRHVRVYTRDFMRDVLAGRTRLRPLSWCLLS